MIRLGIIGLNLDRGWAQKSHLPALRMLPEIRISAIATRHRESAEAAAHALDALHAFDDPEKLIACKDVDLVAIVVNVEAHHALAKAALQAGKMVLSEWPLGASLEQTEDLARLAGQTGARNFVILQGRCNPAISYVRDLVAQGYVGDVLSTSFIGQTAAWGPTLGGASSARLLDKKAGGTILTISVGHALDAICSCLGNLEEVSATIANSYPQVTTEAGEVIPKSAPDQVALQGKLRSGAVLSFHFRAGMPRGTNLHWEINGSKGDLLITGDAGPLQNGQITLFGATREGKKLEKLPIPAHYFREQDESDASNAIVYAYAKILDDIRNGTHEAPDFEAALTLHKTLDAIQKAADEGVRHQF